MVLRREELANSSEPEHYSVDVDNADVFLNGGDLGRLLSSTVFDVLARFGRTPQSIRLTIEELLLRTPCLGCTVDVTAFYTLVRMLRDDDNDDIYFLWSMLQTVITRRGIVLRETGVDTTLVTEQVLHQLITLMLPGVMTRFLADTLRITIPSITNRCAVVASVILTISREPLHMEHMLRDVAVIENALTRRFRAGNPGAMYSDIERHTLNSCDLAPLVGALSDELTVSSDVTDMEAAHLSQFLGVITLVPRPTLNPLSEQASDSQRSTANSYSKRRNRLNRAIDACESSSASMVRLVNALQSYRLALERSPGPKEPLGQQLRSDLLELVIDFCKVAIFDEFGFCHNYG